MLFSLLDRYFPSSSCISLLPSMIHSASADSIDFYVLGLHFPISLLLFIYYFPTYDDIRTDGLFCLSLFIWLALFPIYALYLSACCFLVLRSFIMSCL